MEFFNKHYIIVDGRDRIVDGFSDAFRKPSETDICINEKGGYQFRLFPNGEENPSLFEEHGVPIYRYDGSVAERTSEEIESDIVSILAPLITATHNILANDYVTINNTLYMATKNIPNGEPIIVGQNAIITTIESVLYELKGE